MNRVLENDPELNAKFVVTGQEPEASGERYVLLRCKSCVKAWEVLLNEDGTVGKGERNAVLQHSKAHTEKARMRRVT